MRARNKYFVVLHEGEWKIKNGDQHSHPYPTQREAIDAAIEAAHSSERDGQPSQVLVQGESCSGQNGPTAKTPIPHGAKDVAANFPHRRVARHG
jgi:hypothetical protein